MRIKSHLTRTLLQIVSDLHLVPRRQIVGAVTAGTSSLTFADAASAQVFIPMGSILFPAAWDEPLGTVSAVQGDTVQLTRPLAIDHADGEWAAPNLVPIWPNPTDGSLTRMMFPNGAVWRAYTPDNVIGKIAGSMSQSDLVASLVLQLDAQLPDDAVSQEVWAYDQVEAGNALLETYVSYLAGHLRLPAYLTGPDAIIIIRELVLQTRENRIDARTPLFETYLDLIIQGPQRPVAGG